MSVIVNKLVHMIESYLPSLLRIIIGLGATCAVCLEQREEVKPTAVISLKIVRRLASARIISVSFIALLVTVHIHLLLFLSKLI